MGLETGFLHVIFEMGIVHFGCRFVTREEKFKTKFSGQTRHRNVGRL